MFFLLNAKVWNSYSSYLMKHFTIAKIFTLRRSPGADSFLNFQCGIYSSTFSLKRGKILPKTYWE